MLVMSYCCTKRCSSGEASLHAQLHVAAAGSDGILGGAQNAQLVCSRGSMTSWPLYDCGRHLQRQQPSVASAAALLSLFRRTVAAAAVCGISSSTAVDIPSGAVPAAPPAAQQHASATGRASPATG
jgi:hypothetical protein